MPVVITREDWDSRDRADDRRAMNDYVMAVLAWAQRSEQDDNIQMICFSEGKGECLVCRVPLMDNELAMATFHTVDGVYQPDLRTIGCFDCVEALYLAEGPGDLRGRNLDPYRLVVL